MRKTKRLHVHVHISEVPKTLCSSLAENMFDQFVLRDFDDGKAPIRPTERVSIIIQNYQPGGKHFLHKHDDVEQVYFILKGKARVKLGDEVIEAGEGEFIYIPRGLLHSNENIGEGELKVMLIGVKVV
ncbi:MAG: cupin domain-containing protein [Candidatus Bathyarchaeia archaeon]